MRWLLTTLIIFVSLVLLPGSAKSAEFGPALGYLNEGARAIDRGNIVKGIKLTERALESHELAPANIAAAFNNLCVAQSRIRRFDEALELCNKALSLVGDNWRFYNNRGNAYLGNGKVDEAISDYRHALEMNPDSPMLNKNLRLALERKELGVDGLSGLEQDA